MINETISFEEFFLQNKQRQYILHKIDEITGSIISEIEKWQEDPIITPTFDGFEICYIPVGELIYGYIYEKKLDQRSFEDFFPEDTEEFVEEFANNTEQEDSETSEEENNEQLEGEKPKTVGKQPSKRKYTRRNKQATKKGEFKETTN